MVEGADEDNGLFPGVTRSAKVSDVEDWGDLGVASNVTLIEADAVDGTVPNIMNVSESNVIQEVQGENCAAISTSEVLRR